MNSSLFIILLILISNDQGELAIDFAKTEAISSLVNKQHISEMPHFLFDVMINKIQNAKLNQPSYHTGNPLPPTPLHQTYSFQSSNPNKNCYEEGRKRYFFTMQLSD